MKTFTLLTAIILLSLSVQAQDYKIDFTASGAATTLDSVHVLNLTRQTSIMLLGKDTLHLLGDGTGVSEIPVDAQNMSIFPNPSRHGARLSFHQEEAGETTIEVYNVEGKLLLSKQMFLQSGHHEFRFTGLSTGLFFIHLKTTVFSGAVKLISMEIMTGTPEVVYVHGVKKGKIQTVEKGIKGAVIMQYSDGEPLKFTAYANNYDCIDTLIPTQSQTLDFYFFHTSPPVADFTASHTNITVGDSIDFTDQSTHNPTSWNWDFGDGNSSAIQNPSYAYDSVGTFTVSLVATNSYGSDTETKTDYITVGSSPVADFITNQTNITVGDSVGFTDQSTHNPTGWNWHFGDGDSSNIQNPYHVYDSVGVFTVSLIVSNSHGWDTVTKTDYITVDSTASLYPPGVVFCNDTTAVVDVLNPTTGETWMDRNLGASHQATASNDAQAFGDLYQWGRFADGHQCRNSDTTYTLSATDTPGHGDFIISDTINDNDWRQPKNDSLWQGLNGENNPCPIGYRIPTQAEIVAEKNSWSSPSAADAYASPLKFTVAGRRIWDDGTIEHAGMVGLYVTSTYQSTGTMVLLLYTAPQTLIGQGSRATGRSVRCIKD